MEHRINFKSDLKNIIEQQFCKAGIQYDKELDINSFAARYLEMINRLIIPVPRRVIFSKEIHNSLGGLTHEVKAEQREKALEAWRTVFYLRQLLVAGENVNGFLSKGIGFATGKKSADGLLWDFGMHHLHLSREVETSGFVKRSDYLLFAIITGEHTYFVDVRLHRDPQNLGWVRQELFEIAHSNWPELFEPRILRGVKGDRLTDKEKRELRRKNINHVTELGGNAIGPLGGGTAMNVSSMMCRIFAGRLLHELDRHQSYFDSQPQELRSQLEGKKIEVGEKMEFELVLLDELNWSDELIDALREDQCLSRALCEMGFAVVERTTQIPIIIDFPAEPTT